MSELPMIITVNLKENKNMKELSQKEKYIKIPVGCDILNEFDGGLPELKCLVLIISKIYECGKADCTVIIPYRDFTCLGKAFKRGSGYIKECIADIIAKNKDNISEYFSLGCENAGCLVTLHKTIGKYSYLVDINNVAAFNTLFGMRMYLIYRSNYSKFLKNKQRVFRYMESEFMSYCGCNNRKSVYKMLSRCSDEFSVITGVSMEISKDKRDDIWNITYSQTNNSYDNGLEGE